jgi:hypothetical protein
VSGVEDGPLDTCARTGVAASTNKIAERRKRFDGIDAPMFANRDFFPAIPEPRHFIRKVALVKLFR